MIATARPFADLVFHVLAHVPGDAAASAYDPAYAAWSEARIGPPAERSLAEDARALEALAPTHDALVRAQLLAWLFSDRDRARSVWERPLSELGPNEVDDPSALSVAGDPAAELLWCAVALEDEAHARLPAMRANDVADAALGLAGVAPTITGLDLGIVRSLRLRGRVRGREIWIGEPGAGATLDHVAWQAAHEATAVELGEHDPRLPFASIEHGSVVLLAMRAERAGRAADHARWIAALRTPDPRVESLAPELRAIVEALYFTY